MTIRFGILTVSDRSARHEREDLSGTALTAEVARAGWETVLQAVIPDEEEAIRRMLMDWADCGRVDVICTSGGTGFSARDVTPEATLAVIQRQAPGIAESIRTESLHHTPHAMLSRGVAGIRGKCLIVNLPGSPKGATESFQVIAPVLPHAVELLSQATIPDEHHHSATPNQA